VYNYNNTEEIVLEVDEPIGKTHQKFSLEAKQKSNTAITMFLKQAINDADTTDYQKMLDEINSAA